MTDTLYWIWYQLVFGIGGRRSELMLNYFDTPLEIYEGVSSSEKIRGMLEPAELERAKTALEQAKNLEVRTLKKGCSIITPDSKEYPPLLREIYGKPAALYVKGDLSCLRDALCVAVIGSREATDYGKRVTKMLASGLAASGVTIVSGLARGIDSVAHQAAVDAGGKTVGFLGCGIDVDYPHGSAVLKRAISENGAVVSEFPLGAEPLPYHFPIRNRIVSGSSHAALVTEASARSGALLTAHHAIDQGRDVFAVPGSIFAVRHKGAHMLIREGVKMATCAADILMEYPAFFDPRLLAVEQDTDDDTAPFPEEETQSSKPAKPIVRKEAPDGLSSAAKALYPHIGGNPEKAELLAVNAGLETADALSALTELEIYGLIKMNPGRTFRLC